MSVSGLAWLLLAVNALTAFLGAVTLASYVFVYTPLKRLTVLNTVVGAIPGALLTLAARRMLRPVALIHLPNERASVVVFANHSAGGIKLS